MAGDLALENIEEFLFDEDRVVSYKWLSKTLSLHVNQAKRKLEEFAESWREKPGSKPITLTFFVSGIQETTSGNELTRVAIVREENLENVKKNLKKTLCEHIYSIQKSVLKDTAVLYQTDFDETKQHLSECNKHSAIKCKLVETRPVDSLVPIVTSVPNGRASPAEERKDQVGSSRTSAAPEKKRGLAAFVKQQKTQEKNETKPAKVSPVSEKKQPTSTAKKGSLMHAFQSSKKASPKSETATKEETEASKVEKESKKEDKTQRDEKTDEKKAPSPAKQDDNKSKESPVQKQDKTEKFEKKKETTTRKSSKRDMPDSDSETESKAKARKGTKRRRVFQEESSSEEEESDHEMLEEEEEEVEMDDTPIPPTPEIKSKGREEEVKESPSIEGGNTEEGRKGRKKIWKKKRYLDDDGCMVTQRVFEYESGEGSEDEKEAEGSGEKTSPSTKKDKSPKNQSTSSSPSTDTNSKKESPPNSGRKQTALTSFFKKR